MTKLLLAGKHELACRLAETLVAREGLELGFVLAKSEDTARRRSLCVEAPTSMIIEDGGRPALASAVDRFAPDAVLSAGFDRILKPSVIDRVPCYNIHFGALPKYRGNMSIPRAILNREPEIGVTLHRVRAGIDDGPIVRQTLFPNDPNLSCRALYDIAVEWGVSLGSWLAAQLQAGNDIPEAPQDESRATYYAPGFPGDFQIDWRQTNGQVLDYIRAADFAPYPGAWSELDGKRIEFRWPVKNMLCSPKVKPGRIEELNGHPYVATLNGLIAIERGAR